MSEHAAISVDKVVLLQRVQHDGDAAVEQFGQSGFGVSGTNIMTYVIQVIVNIQLVAQQ